MFLGELWKFKTKSWNFWLVICRSWTPCFISRPPSRAPGAKEEDTVSFREHQDKVKYETVVKCIIQWLTQVRENLGICVTIFGIVMVAVIVTTIKIFLFDKETYPSLFYTPEELEAMKNRTVNNSVRCIYSCPALETTDDVWHLILPFQRDAANNTIFETWKRAEHQPLIKETRQSFNKRFFMQPFILIFSKEIRNIDTYFTFRIQVFIEILQGLGRRTILKDLRKCMWQEDQEWKATGNKCARFCETWIFVHKLSLSRENIAQYRCHPKYNDGKKLCFRKMHDKLW